MYPRPRKLTMKKPLFAALGVAGACAACCSIPLLLPLLGGTAVAALLAGWGLELGTALNALIAAALVALVGTVLWMDTEGDRSFPAVRCAELRIRSGKKALDCRILLVQY